MLQPWLQPFLTAKNVFFFALPVFSKHIPCKRGPLTEGSLATGTMDAPLPQGCTGYQEGMRLTKDSPSWLWKSMRKHLAKGDNKNKAGSMVGKGTTSLTRKEKRKHLQPGYQADNESQHMTGANGTLGKENGGQ